MQKRCCQVEKGEKTMNEAEDKTFDKIGIAIPLLNLSGQKMIRRCLKDMEGLYSDADAQMKLREVNPCIYTYSNIEVPESSGDIAFGVSTIFSGEVGNEYYMTIGHAHEIEETAEVYFGLKGEGVILMEEIHGNRWRAVSLRPNSAVYVPKGYFHRSINTGSCPFTFFFAYRSDAGHNYSLTQECGFRHRIMNENGVPKIFEMAFPTNNSSEVPG